jgi:hypothetical protein
MPFIASRGAASSRGFGQFAKAGPLIGGDNWLGTLTSATDNLYGTTSAVDSSGNVVVVGQNNNTSALVVVKYNSTGTIQWQNNYAVTSSYVYRYNGCNVDSSGNIYIACIIYNPSIVDYDYAVLKLNSSGAAQWIREFTLSGVAITGGNYNIFSKVVVDSSGNVYVAATFAYDQIVIVKYNSAGTQQASRIIGSVASSTSLGGMAIDTTNSYIYISGTSTQSSGGTVYGFMSQLDFSLNISASRYFRDSGNSLSYNLALDSSNNIYVLGATGTNLGASNVRHFVVKLNSSLTVQWNSYTTASIFTIQPNCIAIDSSGNSYIGGSETFNSTFVLYSLDSAGTTLRWGRRYGPPAAIGYPAISMAISSSSYIFSGPNNSSSSNDYFAYAKLPTDGTKTGTYTVGAISYTYSNYSFLSVAAGTLTTSASAYMGGSGTINYYTPTVTATTSTYTSAIVV